MNRRAGVAAAGIAALLASGLLAAVTAGPSGAAAQTIDSTCTFSFNGSPGESYTRRLTVEAVAPDSVAPLGAMTVDVVPHAEDLPMTSVHPQFVADYENIETDYSVVGGTIDPNSIVVTQPAVTNTVALPSNVVNVTANGNVVSALVAAAVAPGTFVMPEFTFSVTADADAASVDVTAVQHLESTDFSGPGAPETGIATCPMNTPVASTAVQGAGTTTTSDTSGSTTTTTDTTPTTDTTSTSTSTTSTTSTSSTTTSTTSSTTSTSLGTDPISIADASVVEPPPSHVAKMAFVLTRTSGHGKATVRISTVDGTAVHHKDFVYKDALITFQPGQTTVVTFVQVKPDKSADGTETFTVVLSKPHNATIGRGTATGTIYDR